MSHAEKLMKAGAECVGGFMYLNRVHVGTYKEHGFVLTEQGMDAVLALVEPEAEAPAPAPAPAPKAKKSKSAEAPAPAPADEDPLGGLDLDV